MWSHNLVCLPRKYLVSHTLCLANKDRNLKVSEFLKKIFFFFIFNPENWCETLHIYKYRVTCLREHVRYSHILAVNNIASPILSLIYPLAHNSTLNLNKNK